MPNRVLDAASIGRRAAAWSVHLFTASGAVIGVAALLAIGRGDLPLAAILMLVTLAIDSVDGTLARRVGVSQILPKIDGRRLDDMVDFFNFAIVPAVFMVSAGSIAGWGWVSFPVIASCYGFSCENAKTEDDFFLGFPSYWNVLALYLWKLDLGAEAGTVWLVSLSIAVFIPLKYVYPSKLRILWWVTNLGGALWSWILAAAIFFPDWAQRYDIVRLTLVYPIYYVVLSAWLGRWGRPTVHH